MDSDSMKPPYPSIFEFVVGMTMEQRLAYMNRVENQVLDDGSPMNADQDWCDVYVANLEDGWSTPADSAWYLIEDIVECEKYTTHAHWAHEDVFTQTENLDPRL